MLSSSLFLRSSATLVSVLSLLIAGASSAYVLNTEFSGSTFFNGFDFFDVCPLAGVGTVTDADQYLDG